MEYVGIFPKLAAGYSIAETRMQQRSKFLVRLLNIVRRPRTARNSSMLKRKARH